MPSNENPFEDDSNFDDVNLLGGQSDPFSDPSVRGQIMAGQNSLDQFGEDVFASNESLQGSIGGGTESNGRQKAQQSQWSAARSNSSASGDGQAAQPRAGGFCGFLSVQYYQHYFDVNTDDVIERLKRVLMPWKNDFFQVVDGRPDFYGPFWVCSTLVFLIAATSNFVSWLNSDTEGGEPWQDFKVLSYGASLVFGFCVAMPFVAWACFSYLGVSTAGVTFVELACVYGYSMFTFTIASIICTIPIDLVEWLSVLAAVGCSATFVVRNLWVRLGATPETGGYLPPMSSTGDDLENSESSSLVVSQPGRKAAAIFLVGMFGLHFVFALILKLKFFGKSNMSK